MLKTTEFGREREGLLATELFYQYHLKIFFFFFKMELLPASNGHKTKTESSLFWSSI